MLGEADCDAPGVPVSNSVVQQNLHSDVVCVKLSSSKVKVETHIQPQAKLSHHSRSNCITATAQLHNNIHEPNPTNPTRRRSEEQVNRQSRSFFGSVHVGPKWDQQPNYSQTLKTIRPNNPDVLDSAVQEGLPRHTGKYLMAPKDMEGSRLHGLFVLAISLWRSTSISDGWQIAATSESSAWLSNA